MAALGTLAGWQGGGWGMDPILSGRRVKRFVLRDFLFQFSFD